MGRLGWIGIVVLGLSTAAITRGVNLGHEPHDGLVALSRSDVVQALLESFGLAALPFGLIFALGGAISHKEGKEIPTSPRIWARAFGLFIALWATIGFVFLGPDLLAQRQGKDWKWADQISSNLIPVILGLVLLIQHRGEIRRWATQVRRNGST